MRSAVSSSRVGAVTLAISVPGSTSVAVGDEVARTRSPPAPHTISITAAATGSPATTPARRAPNVADADAGRAGTVAVDVTSIAAGEVLGDRRRGRAPRRRRGRARRRSVDGACRGERVEHEHRRSPASRSVKRSGRRMARRTDTAPTASRRDVEVGQPSIVAASGSRCDDGTRDSRFAPCAAATTAAATVSMFVPSQRPARRWRRSSAGRVRSRRALRPRSPATPRRGSRRRGATSPRGLHRIRVGSISGIRRPARSCSRSGSTRSGSSQARSRPTRVPATTDSVRLFDASRLAPCTPVQVTSPTAKNPGSAVTPVEVGRDAAAGVVRGRRDRDPIDRRVDADLAARRGDRRETARRTARPCAWRRGTRGRRRRPAPRPSAG